MPDTVHRGFIVHSSCQCLEVGVDGTRDHRGPLSLIEISVGLSKGRRTKSCENHLNGYLNGPGGWVIIERYREIVVNEESAVKELKA